MKKRGQIYGSWFKFFLIGFIAVMIILFGINALNRVRSASCRTGLILFEDSLEESVKGVYSDVGGVNEESFNVPCDIDRIYFVDLDKDMDRLFKSLYEYPLVKDSIKDNVEKNVFLVRNNKVINSFYVGDIELQKPYFVCSDTVRGNLGLYLGSKGDSIEVVNKQCALDCTFEVVSIDEDTAAELINDTINRCKGNGCLNGTLEDELRNFNETNKTVRIARRCNCGREPGTTVVEILIKPEGSVSHFKLIEKIPKDFVDDLRNIYLENMSGDYDYFKVISPDPLIMWHFDEISEETVVKYVLDVDVLEYCAEVLETVGVGVTVESEGLQHLDPDIAKEVLDEPPEDEPFTFDLPDDVIEIDTGGTNRSVFNGPIWHIPYAYDLRGKRKEIEFEDYDYEISVGTSYGTVSNYPSGLEGEYSIKCEILVDGNVKCSVGSEFSEISHAFSIRVSSPDGSELAVDEFTVSIPILDCGGETNKVGCEAISGCEWCDECKDNKWSGDVSRCVIVGNCQRSCIEGKCGAVCDSNSDLCDGCIEIKYFFDCSAGVGCQEDCTLSCPTSYTDVMNLGCIKGSNSDGDHYDDTCEYGCHENEYIYPGNNNEYCDCNPPEESYTEDCTDTIDNDCDGNIDFSDNDCILKKARCFRAEYGTGCDTHACGDSHCVDKLGAGWKDAGFQPCFLGWECQCKYDQWTECSLAPTCPVHASPIETSFC